VPPKFFFFFATSQFDWSPKIEASILKYRVPPPLWPTCIGERRTTFAKAYGVKVRCYGKHVGEHIGNLGEHIGNLMGT